MSDERPSKIGMKPPHPGDFIRTEILRHWTCQLPVLPRFWADAAPHCRT